MKKATGTAVAATALLLTGCGSPSDANEKNFGASIGKYLEKNGALCLNMTQWPVDVSDMDRRVLNTPTGMAARMAALEAVGLTQGADVEIDRGSYKIKVTRYTLTDAAKPFERQKEVELLGFGGTTKETRTDLCWGRKVLDQVVKWEGPMKFGDYQRASVTYHYRIVEAAEWAKKPEFLAAFPHVGQMAANAGKKEQQHVVKLTSVGWEAKGLDN